MASLIKRKSLAIQASDDKGLVSQINSVNDEYQDKHIKLKTKKEQKKIVNQNKRDKAKLKQQQKSDRRYQKIVLTADKKASKLVAQLDKDITKEIKRQFKLNDYHLEYPFTIHVRIPIDCVNKNTLCKKSAKAQGVEFPKYSKYGIPSKFRVYIYNNDRFNLVPKKVYDALVSRYKNVVCATNRHRAYCARYDYYYEAGENFYYILIDKDISEEYPML